MSENYVGRSPGLSNTLSTSVRRRTFTASGTWTKPSGLRAIVVTVIGGGGAGGGAPASGASQWSVGAGGGEGGTAIKTFDAASVGASETVTVGTGGVGVSAAAGGNGVASSFGATLSATGGTGGGVAGPSTNSAVIGGAGGLGAGGDINVRGASGGLAMASQSGNFNFSGFGGGNGVSGGVQGTGNGAPPSANAYGAGGGGALNTPSQAAQTGGNGSPGIVIVDEYFSDVGVPPAGTGSIGRMLQTQQHVRTDFSSSSPPAIPLDNTKPQISEGSEFFTVTITPQQVGSLIVIDYLATFTFGGASGVMCALFRSDQVDALATQMSSGSAADAETQVKLGFDLVTASLTPLTFSVRGAAGGGVMRLNGRSGGALFGGSYNSYLRVREYSQ